MAGKKAPGGRDARESAYKKRSSPKRVEEAPAAEDLGGKIPQRDAATDSNAVRPRAYKKIAAKS